MHNVKIKKLAILVFLALNKLKRYLKKSYQFAVWITTIVLYPKHK